MAAASHIPKPTIGISMGDPTGIGAEVVVKALMDPALRGSARFVIYGLNELLTYAADQMEAVPFWYRVQHDSPRAQRGFSEPIVVLDYDDFDGSIQNSRTATKQGGLASKTFVEDAITDALLPAEHPRYTHAIVTAPICKQSWQMAGYRWPGHTELLANRCKAKRVVMAFSSPQLNVALATAHLPLMQVRDILNIGRVFDPIDLGNDACKMLGIEHPRIAVCGLNPHAGEGGALGAEEQLVITPAIEMAQAARIDVHGPFPADTIFNRAMHGEFDLVVAMYHDQGLIPIKLLAWETAVNWTLGLPIIRTSPDHGTAFDIAGRGVADASSMKSAIQLAVKLAQQRMAASHGLGSAAGESAA